MDFTTVIGIDDEHLQELLVSWETWKRFRPEIFQHPILWVCDAHMSDDSWHALEWNGDVADIDMIYDDARVPEDFPTQRAKMLTALARAAEQVETPYMLKLDTDTIAIEEANWLRPEWFENGEVLAASPWGYTKPADAIKRLDDWADNAGLLGRRMDLPIARGSSLVRCPRIIGWFTLMKTEFALRSWRCTSGQLPIPSHDTFLWYMAERFGHKYTRFQMKNVGWRHYGSLEKLKRIAAEALG